MRGLALWRDHLYFNEGGHVIRTLKFIVDGVTVTPDPTCDFTGLFPGKEELRVEFDFSDDWYRALTVAGFYSVMGTEYEPQVVVNSGCVVPAEASASPVFKIILYGTKGHGNVIKSDEIIIRQGGKR